MRSRRHALPILLVALALAASARGAVQLSTLDTPGSIRDLALDGTVGYVPIPPAACA
jgi:hypothetical protein